MKINVYSISKNTTDEYELLNSNFIKMSSKWVSVTNNNIFTKDISKEQIKGEQYAKSSYTKEFNKYIGAYNIALTPNGKSLDTEEFSRLIDGKSEVNFFIGGAYGFDDTFLNSTQEQISLSTLTYSHKIAKVVLFEQVYRALTLINSHPYHKV